MYQTLEDAEAAKVWGEHEAGVYDEVPWYDRIMSEPYGRSKMWIKNIVTELKVDAGIDQVSYISPGEKFMFLGQKEIPSKKFNSSYACQIVFGDKTGWIMAQPTLLEFVRII